ncbi:MAG: nickel-responsive transcriptional regulator NikR [Rhodobacteraceae bacterium]|nr:nickel-responsive transcriptional regulator NikR [Paracoccaceae bacterium]
MQRVTITIDDDLLARLDALMQETGARNRSETLRDLLRRALEGPTPKDAQCLGVLSCAVESARRDLGRRLAEHRLAHHDATIAALSVPLDHGAALEVIVAQGRVGAIERFANGLFLERGVRHGALSLVPVERLVERHAHGEAAHSHEHLRLRDSFSAPPGEGEGEGAGSPGSAPGS